MHLKSNRPFFLEDRTCWILAGHMAPKLKPHFPMFLAARTANETKIWSKGCVKKWCVHILKRECLCFPFSVGNTEMVGIVYHVGNILGDRRPRGGNKETGLNIHMEQTQTIHRTPTDLNFYFREKWNHLSWSRHCYFGAWQSKITNILLNMVTEKDAYVPLKQP